MTIYEATVRVLDYNGFECEVRASGMPEFIKEVRRACARGRSMIYAYRRKPSRNEAGVKP